MNINKIGKFVRSDSREFVTSLGDFERSIDKQPIAQEAEKLPIQDPRIFPMETKTRGRKNKKKSAPHISLLIHNGFI